MSKVIANLLKSQFCINFITFCFLLFLVKLSIDYGNNLQKIENKNFIYRFKESLGLSQKIDVIKLFRITMIWSVLAFGSIMLNVFISYGFQDNRNSLLASIVIIYIMILVFAFCVLVFLLAVLENPSNPKVFLFLTISIEVILIVLPYRITKDMSCWQEFCWLVLFFTNMIIAYYLVNTKITIINIFKSKETKECVSYTENGRQYTKKTTIKSSAMLQAILVATITGVFTLTTAYITSKIKNG